MEKIKKPFFSVILSTFKEKDEVILRSVNSILNQSFSNFEFIIVKDDPSRSIETFEKLSKLDSRIKTIYNKSNIGLTKSLLISVLKAKGEYIVRQDADDISLKQRLKNAHEYLIKNHSVDFYSTPYIIDNKIKPLTMFQRVYSQNTIRYKNFLAHGALIIRLKVLKKINYDPTFKFAQDFDLYNRLTDSGIKLFFDRNNISYIIGTGPDRISNLNKKEQMNFHSLVLKRNGFNLLNNKIVKLLRLDVILDLLYYVIKR